MMGNRKFNQCYLVTEMTILYFCSSINGRLLNALKLFKRKHGIFKIMLLKKRINGQIQ